MPIFVGTGDTSSRIRSNRVGFASHSANPGTASEGDVYFNSSDGGLRAYDGSAWSAVGAGGGTFSGIASGTLSNGQTVIIQSNGTVVGVSSTALPQGFGSAKEFDSSVPTEMSTAYDSTNNKIVIAYIDNGNSNYGTAVVGTVSGTSISFGTPVVYNNANSPTPSATFDSTNGKVVIAYKDYGTSQYGKAIVGTVSGTSISFGSEVQFEAAIVPQVSATFDSTNGKIVLAYKDYANPTQANAGTVIVGTVSGTSISFDTATVFNDASQTQNISAIYDSTNGKVVIAFREADGNTGQAIVFNVTSSSNLTSTNFLGFSDAAYSDGATAKVQIVGSIDDAQTGLTTGSIHYVQRDGSLGVAASDPSVVAGIALTDTKILIRK